MHDRLISRNRGNSGILSMGGWVVGLGLGGWAVGLGLNAKSRGGRPNGVAIACDVPPFLTCTTLDTILAAGPKMTR